MAQKQLHLIWKCFLLSNISIQLTGLIEEHLNFGPTTDWVSDRSTDLHKSCLKSPKKDLSLNFKVQTALKQFDVDVGLTLF